MLTPEDVVRAADVLSPLADVPDTASAWTAVVPGGWTASRTIEHIGDALAFYAGQVARRATGPLPVLRDGRTGPPSEQLDVLRTTAHLVAGQLRDLGAAQAWHPSGMADAAGWAGMAVTELLVHGWDAAALLDVRLELPADLCRRTLARVFPWVDRDLGDPGTLLLGVTGRAAVAGVADDPLWWWQSAPLDAWDGRPRRRDVPPGWT